MITVHVRKQGGAAVITIPASVLKQLNIGVGAEMELKISQKKMVVRPIETPTRKRYALVELLVGVTPQKAKALNRQTQWAREGKLVGREIT